MGSAARARRRPWFGWVATGAIGAVVVSAGIHFPASPAQAASPTPFSVGDAPCVQQVSAEDALTVEILTEDDGEGGQVPTDCLLTFTQDTLWEVPHNVTEVWAVIVGGGGGGSQLGGGGGGAVYDNDEVDVFDPAANGPVHLDIQIGVGGSGSSSGTGGSGGPSSFANITSSGGTGGGADGSGGQSGNNTTGGAVSTDGTATAGGGGGGHGSPGTGGIIERPVGMGPAIDSFEEISPPPADPESSDPPPAGDESADSGSEGTDATEESTTSESDHQGSSEPEHGANGDDSEPQVELFQQSEADPDPVIRSGSGGHGVSTDITGNSMFVGGGGAGAFDTGGEDGFDEQLGQNGDGGGSLAIGGGGAAGQDGGNGLVIIRYAIPDKDIQTLTWSVDTELEVADSPVVLPEATTTGNGVITYEVAADPTSNCVLTDSLVDDGDGGTVRLLTLTYDQVGECVIMASAAETSTFQAASLSVTFAVLAPAAVLSAITPTAGPAAGNTEVTITGTNLSQVTEVLFGDLPGTDLEVNEAGTSLTVTTPLRFGPDLTAETVNVTAVTLTRPAISSLTFAFQSGQYMLDNNRLRFGGNTSCSSGCTNFSTVNSINNGGNLLQPFYRSGDTWYKLTFSTFPLDMAIGTGSGSNWTGSAVVDTQQSNSPLLNMRDRVVSSPDFVAQDPAASILRGYGTVIVRGTVTVNGFDMVIQNTYELGANSSFVKITTQIEKPHE